MKKLIAAIIMSLPFCLISFTESPAAPQGEALFMKNCQTCHKGGGNIINSKKTLKRKDLRANKIDTVDAIVKNMRNPGPGMTKFDETSIPDDEAKAIAKYILKTFK